MMPFSVIRLFVSLIVANRFKILDNIAILDHKFMHISNYFSLGTTSIVTESECNINILDCPISL